VATETDAARDRVLAARADLAEELQVLEASAKAAVDIPAKIRRSPAKAAAVAGGVGFLAVGGPRRVFRAAKRAVRGPETPLPTSMLPDEIERSLRAMGTDGDRVRGSLERDFAAYAAKAQRERNQFRTLLVVSVLRPFLLRGTKAAMEALFSADPAGFQKRLDEIRARTGRVDAAAADASTGAGGADASESPRQTEGVPPRTDAPSR